MRITSPRCGFVNRGTFQGRCPWLNYIRTFGASEIALPSTDSTDSTDSIDSIDSPDSPDSLDSLDYSIIVSLLRRCDGEKIVSDPQRVSFKKLANALLFA